MKLTKRMCLLLILCSTVLLQSCSSIGSPSGLTRGKTRRPDSEKSSLIYGYLDINHENRPKTNIYFTTWEYKSKIVEAQRSSNDLGYMEEFMLVYRYDESSFYVELDPKTGIFTIEITEPGDYCLDRISVADFIYGLYNHGEVNMYQFSLPETPADGIAVNAGETIFWGAQEFAVDEDGDVQLVPSMKITKEQVLDLVALKLEGKGWDAWIERERAEM